MPRLTTVSKSAEKDLLLQKDRSQTEPEGTWGSEDRKMRRTHGCGRGKGLGTFYGNAPTDGMEKTWRVIGSVSGENPTEELAWKQMDTDSPGEEESGICRHQGLGGFRWGE